MRHNPCLTLLSVLLIFFTFACNKNGQTPGKQQNLEDAIELTKNDWNKYDYAIAWDEPIPANTQIDIVLGGGKENEVSPEYETWLIVADTNPLANGGPHYKWIFVSTQTGRTSTLMTTSIPFTSQEDPGKHIIVLKEGKIIEPQKASPTPAPRRRLSNHATSSANNCWAITQYGTYFAPYEASNGISADYSEVWVTFDNPLGESTTIVRMNDDVK